MSSRDLLERALIMCLCTVVIVVLIFCTGCAEPPPESGYVRDKSFTPAHWEGGYDTEYRTEYRCEPSSTYDYGSGKYVYGTSCGFKSVPHSVWDDHDSWIEDRWRLYLEDCTRNDEGKEKCRKGWRTVDSQSYDRYGLGDHFPDAR